MVKLLNINIPIVIYDYLLQKYNINLYNYNFNIIETYYIGPIYDNKVEKYINILKNNNNYRYDNLKKEYDKLLHNNYQLLDKELKLKYESLEQQYNNKLKKIYDNLHADLSIKYMKNEQYNLRLELLKNVYERYKQLYEDELNIEKEYYFKKTEIEKEYEKDSLNNDYYEFIKESTPEPIYLAPEGKQYNIINGHHRLIAFLYYTIVISNISNLDDIEVPAKIVE